MVVIQQRSRPLLQTLPQICFRFLRRRLLDVVAIRQQTLPLHPTDCCFARALVALRLRLLIIQMALKQYVNPLVPQLLQRRPPLGLHFAPLRCDHFALISFLNPVRIGRCWTFHLTLACRNLPSLDLQRMQPHCVYSPLALRIVVQHLTSVQTPFG